MAFHFVLPKLIYNIVLFLFQVNNNGYLTFDEPLSQLTSSYLQSKLNRDFIAPLWTDMDSTVSGTISYRQVASGRLLLAASNNINQYFPNLNFTASWLFIATWDKVPYYNNSQSVRYLFSVIIHIWQFLKVWENNVLCSKYHSSNLLWDLNMFNFNIIWCLNKTSFVFF